MAIVTGKQIGRAHVWTPVTPRNLVCRLLLEKQNSTVYTYVCGVWSPAGPINSKAASGAGLCRVMGWTLEEVCQANLDKLASRKGRGVIDGNGDNR